MHLSKDRKDPPLPFLSRSVHSMQVLCASMYEKLPSPSSQFEGNVLHLGLGASRVMQTVPKQSGSNGKRVKGTKLGSFRDGKLIGAPAF